MGFREWVGAGRARPSAASIAAQIAAAEARLGELQAEAAAADEHAVALSALPDAADDYEAAASAARTAAAGLAAAADRLRRLRAAHAAAVEAERADAIEHWTREVERRRSQMRAIGEQVAAARAEEDRRHAEAIAELDRRIATEKCALEDAKRELQALKAQADAGKPWTAEPGRTAGRTWSTEVPS